MPQNPIVFVGQSFWILFSLLVTTGTGQTAITSKAVIKYSKGIILNPVIETTVIFDLACAVICRKQLVCYAFSIKKLSAGHVQCLISVGEFQWTPDPDAELFGEYVENIDGYHFGQDGYLYKLFTSVSKQGMYETKEACLYDEDATLAVPYPDFKYEALMSTPGVADPNILFYLGAYRYPSTNGNVSSTVWITDDGVFFDTENKITDMDQKWAPIQPDGSGDWMAGYGNGTWDDTSSVGTRHYVCRKSVARYVRSPANGIYYWASNREATQQPAAQKRCEADGGTLATITQIADVTATVPFRIRLKSDFWGLYWVAGTDKVEEGTWVISNTRTMYKAERQTDPVQMQFFHVGEPRNDTARNCLAMTEDGAITWGCSLHAPALCQITLA